MSVSMLMTFTCAEKITLLSEPWVRTAISRSCSVRSPYSTQERCTTPPPDPSVVPQPSGRASFGNRWMVSCQYARSSAESIDACSAAMKSA